MTELARSAGKLGARDGLRSLTREERLPLAELASERKPIGGRMIDTETGAVQLDSGNHPRRIVAKATEPLSIRPRDQAEGQQEAS